MNLSIGILGLGYVGLPLARAFVSSGNRVFGFDTDPTKIEKLNQRKGYIQHFDFTPLHDALSDDNASDNTDSGNTVTAGQFIATSDMSRLNEPDNLVICVPTPLSSSRDPDLRFVENTGLAITQKLRQGQLVVLESTTYPGTTRDVLLPILEQSGLTVGQDFFLAYSPEREDPGNQQFETATMPKVVGGHDRKSLKRASDLYSTIIQKIVPVDNCEIAEASKILENTYRSVNIAMVNELKLLFAKLGIDIWSVIEAAKTKPFGFQAFYPGPGLGGHCIPIDPFYLSWLARKHEMTTRFIELAGEVNASMPEHVVSQIICALNSRSKSVKGSRIGILGVAYKKDIDDHRETPAFKIIERLRELEAEISYSDPHVQEIRKSREFNPLGLKNQTLTAEYLQSLDCAVITTAHSAFDYSLIGDHASLIVDSRNAMSGVSCQPGQLWPA